jgi:superfamily I DNA and/or RNA helicase
MYNTLKKRMGGISVSIREKVKNLFLYLQSIKKLNYKITKNVNEYVNNFDLIELRKEGALIKNDNSIELLKDSCKLYDRFFKLYLFLQKKNEEFELVWGEAILACKLNNKKIIHPIITIKMDLSFDAEKEKLVLRPCENGIKLESNVLEGLCLHDIDNIYQISEELKEYKANISNIENISDILNKIVNYLSLDFKKGGEIRWEEILFRDIKVDKLPTLYNSSILIFRKTEHRIWDEELKNIIERIDSGFEIPPSVQALVDDTGGFYSEEECAAALEKEEILFPLPDNDEQRKVAASVRKNFGVVVQGPPGTGKSHTIANLICDCLSQGKRVLVTSQTEKALKVICEKIPDEIRALCISVLGSDNKALEDTEKAIRKITENLCMNKEEIESEILSLKGDLENCRKKQEQLYNRLKKAELMENERVNFDDKNYSLVDIAKWIRDNRKDYSWILDDIDDKCTCPITDEEFNRLLELLRDISGENLKNIDGFDRIAEEIPKCEDFIELLKYYKRLSSIYGEAIETVQDWSIDFDKNYDFSSILKVLDEAKNKIEYFEKKWMRNIFKYYYSSSVAKNTFDQVILDFKKYIKIISENTIILNIHKVELPVSCDMDKFKRDFYDMYNSIKSKNNISRIFSAFHKEPQYLLRDCRVDNKPVKNNEQIDIIKRYVDKHEAIRDLVSLWNENMVKFGAEDIKDFSVEAASFIEKSINEVELITKWDDNYKNKIIEIMAEIKTFKELKWYEGETYRYLQKVVISIKYINEYKRLVHYINNIYNNIHNIKGLEEFTEAIEKCDEDKLIAAYRHMEKIKGLKRELKEINVVFTKLQNLCPKLLNELILKTSKKCIDFKYNSFETAWKWKQFNSIIKKVHITNPEDIEEKMQIEKNREKEFIKQLVARQTWYNQILKTNESQRRSLYAWIEAAKKIGKGNGKQAAKYRRMARNEMEKCKDVIPVWIMSLNKVIENLPLNNNLFDVVIIDESSQSNLFAICALMRGKKAVIIGDDKQISPEAIGINRGKVEVLQNKHLTDIPQYEWLDLTTSLYNICLRVFPERLVLKEHFRCDPKIIGFSNTFCYSNGIIPLRLPKKSNKFKYPLKEIKVENAFKDKVKNVNIKEAEAIVNTIVECCSDKKYDGMTMGVISLLGNSQAELIENMLRERLGDKKIVDRKIICGDAYSFQGDERDVIFLSMVIAKNAKYGVLVKDSDIRRFNVASSRAKNQMFLFHSVDLEDLNPKGVRAVLLRYFMDQENKREKKTKEENMFLSQFKKDFYKFIKNRGYGVKSEIKIGKYKIDFVIEGMTKSIAVECDGDRIGGINEWEKQYEKQIILGRMGWEFLNIRGSEFYLDPEKTMEKLLDKLN